MSFLLIVAVAAALLIAYTLGRRTGRLEATAAILAGRLEAEAEPPQPSNEVSAVLSHVQAQRLNAREGMQ